MNDHISRSQSKRSKKVKKKNSNDLVARSVSNSGAAATNISLLYARDEETHIEPILHKIHPHTRIKCRSLLSYTKAAHRSKNEN